MLSAMLVAPEGATPSICLEYSICKHFCRDWTTENTTMNFGRWMPDSIPAE